MRLTESNKIFKFFMMGIKFLINSGLSDSICGAKNLLRDSRLSQTLLSCLQSQFNLAGSGATKMISRID